MYVEKRGARGRTVDCVLAIALAAVGFANLALPLNMQRIVGVDYLLLVFALLALSILLRLPTSLGRPIPWIASIVLMLAVLPGILAAPISEYGSQKIQTFVLVALSLVSAASLSRPERGVRIYLGAALLLSLLFSILMLTTSSMTVTGRISLIGLNPIGVARLTTLGAVLLVALLVSGRVRGLFRVLASIGLAGLCLVATIVTGSRGPVIGLAISLVVVIGVTLGVRGARAGWIVLLAVLAVAIMASALLGDAEGVEWAIGRGDSGRASLYSTSVGLMAAHPAGVGWGEFSTIAVTGDIAYPHNLYLEAGAEGGIIAFVVVLVLTGIALVWAMRTYRQTGRASDLLLLAVYAYALANAQLSSDIVGNRMLWVTMAFVMVSRVGAVRFRAHDGRCSLVSSPSHRPKRRVATA